MSAEQQQVATSMSENFNILLQREDTRELMEELSSLKDILPKFYDFALAYIEQQSAPEADNARKYNNYWRHLFEKYIATLLTEYFPGVDIENMIFNNESHKDPTFIHYVTTSFITTAKISIHAPILGDSLSIKKAVDDEALSVVNLDQLADEDVSVREWFLNRWAETYQRENAWWFVDEDSSSYQIAEAIDNNEKFLAGIKLDDWGDSYREIVSSIIFEFLKREDVTASEYFDYLAKRIQRHDRFLTRDSNNEPPSNLSDVCIFNPKILGQREIDPRNFIFQSIAFLKNSTQPDTDFKKIRFVSQRLGVDKLFCSSEEVQLHAEFIDETIHKVSRDTLLEVLTLNEPDKQLIGAIISRYFDYLKNQHQDKTLTTELTDLAYLLILKQQYNFSSLGKIENLDLHNFILPEQTSDITTHDVFQMVLLLDPQQQVEIFEMNLAKNAELIKNINFFNAYLESLMQVEYNESIAKKFYQFYRESFSDESFAHTALLELEDKVETSKSEKQKKLNILTGKLIECCLRDHCWDNLDNSCSKLISKLSPEIKNQISQKAYDAILRQYLVNRNTTVIAASSSASDSQAVGLSEQSLDRLVGSTNYLFNLTNVKPLPILNNQLAIDLWRYHLKSKEYNHPIVNLIKPYFTSNPNVQSFIKDYLFHSKDQHLTILKKLKAIIWHADYAEFIESLDDEQHLKIFDTFNFEEQLEYLRSQPTNRGFQQQCLARIISRDLSQPQIEKLIRDFFTSKYASTPNVDLAMLKTIVEKAKNFDMSHLDLEIKNHIEDTIGNRRWVYDDDDTRDMDLASLELSKLINKSSLSSDAQARIYNLILEQYIKDNSQELFSDLTLPGNKQIVFKHLKYILDAASTEVMTHSLTNLNKFLFMPKISLQHLEILYQINPEITNLDAYVNKLIKESDLYFESENIEGLKTFFNFVKPISQNVNHHLTYNLRQVMDKYLKFFIVRNGNDFISDLALLQDIKNITFSDTLSNIISENVFDKALQSIEHARNTPYYLDNIYYALLAITLIREESDKLSYVEKLLSPISDESQQQLLIKLIDDFLSDEIHVNDYDAFNIILITLMSKYPKTAIDKLNAVAGEDKNKKLLEFFIKSQNVPLEIILELGNCYPTLIFNNALMKRLSDQIQSSDFNVYGQKVLKIIYQLAANGQRGKSFNELANYLLQKLLERETFDYEDIKIFLSAIPQLILTEENKKSLSSKLDEYLKEPDASFYLYDISLCYIKHDLYLSESAFQSLKAKFSLQYKNSSDLAFYNFLVEKIGIDAFKLNQFDIVPTFSLAIYSDNTDEIKFLANQIKILFQKFSYEQQDFFINFLTKNNPETNTNLIHQMVIEGNLELLSAILPIAWRTTDHRESNSLNCNLLGQLSLDDDSFVTPLAMAILCNATNSDNLPYVDIARALVTHQKNTLNVVLPDGLTALHLAAKLGDLAMVTMLLAHENNTDKNVTLNFRARLGTVDHNAREYTALDFAIDNGHVEVVKYLIANGCDYLSQRRHINEQRDLIYSYPIERAAKHPEIFAYFLTLEGIDIHKKFPTNANDDAEVADTEKRETLLKHCIDNNNLAGIKQLLEMGVDINERVHLESKLSETDEGQIDNFYGPYLIYAVKNLKIEAVKLLLSYYPKADWSVYKNDAEYKTAGAYLEELQQAQQVQEDNVSFTEIIAAITSDFKTEIAHLKSSVSTFCEELESEKPFCEFSDDELNLMAEFSGSVKYKNAYEHLGEQELHVIHKQSVAAYLTSITQEISLRKNSFEAFFTEENCQLLAGLMMRNDERAINFFNDILSMSGRSEDNETVKEGKPIFEISEQCARKLEQLKNAVDAFNSKKIDKFRTKFLDQYMELMQLFDKAPENMSAFHSKTMDEFRAQLFEQHMKLTSMFDKESVDIDAFHSEKIDAFRAQLFEQHINLIHLLDDKELPLHVMIQIECESSAPDVNNLKTLVDKLLHEAKTSQSRINWQALKQKLIHLQATWPMRGGSNQVQGHEALTAIINRVDEPMVMKAARMRMRDISTELYAFFAQRKKNAEPFKKESEQPEASPCDEIDESRLAACSY